MIQRGMNNLYPEKIETWKVGEKVPEWLSDNAKVLSLDDEGNIRLDTNKLSTGGIAIKNSSGFGVLVELKTINSIVCYSPGKIFSLKPEQLELLYVEEECKKK